MPIDPMQLLSLKPPSRGPNHLRRARESMDTLMLGVLSLGVGVFVAVVVLSAFAGKLMPRWHGTFPLTTTVDASQYVWEEDLHSGQRTARWVVSSASGPMRGEVLVPSASCAVVALIGAFLGGAGAWIAWRRGRLSVSCITGAGVCVLAPFVGISYAIVLEMIG